jgi:thiamine-phosphate pyrophosphorylase
MPEKKLLQAVSQAISGGVQIVQIWNATGKAPKDTLRVAKGIHSKTLKQDIPLIVNNDLSLAKKLDAEGIHFDDFQVSASEARRLLQIDAIVGYTCGNDQTRVRKTESLGADYLSFCAVFPSPSVESCEIVPLESVRQAKNIVHIPVFASGGITPENAHLVLGAGADGLAIASSILKSANPKAAAEVFRQILDDYLSSRAKTETQS